MTLVFGSFCKSCGFQFSFSFTKLTVVSVFRFIFCAGRVLFQYPGNLPELPGLSSVFGAKKNGKPVEVVATPVTEMLQCDMPY